MHTGTLPGCCRTILKIFLAVLDTGKMTPITRTLLSALFIPRRQVNLRAAFPMSRKSQLSIKSKDNITAAKAGEDELKPLKLGISTTFLSLGDLGEVTINLKLLPAYVVKLVRQVDEEFKKPDWQTNNYGTENQLLNDVINALNDAVLPSLTVPLDTSDPDSTALKIYNDATMAWAHGDEGLTSAEDQARRQKGNKLLQSDELVSIIKGNAIKS